MKIAVIDMQPIDPPTGGGRLRLLGLYHDLGFETRYVGTYDWPGPSERTVTHSKTLIERTVPLSPEHFERDIQLKARAGGKTVIDSLFAKELWLSLDYVNAVRDAYRWADVIVLSHPWAWPAIAEFYELNAKPLIYDAHNVEGLLRQRLLDDEGFGAEVVKAVLEVECAVVNASDLVLVCSHEDAEGFNALYDCGFEKFRIAPNGAFESKERLNLPRRTSARRQLGLSKRSYNAVFLASRYHPNVEAAQFIIDELAPRLPQVNFVILGGVGEALDKVELDNVTVTGFVDDDEKLAWLAACDLAINPMFSGSGTNIKMLEYMAAGLPVVSTATGARGIAQAGKEAFKVVEPEKFASEVHNLYYDDHGRKLLAERGRDLVKQFYSWEQISKDLGRYFSRLDGERPFFSVVVPTYMRPKHLRELLGALSHQTYRKFEVILIDQSPKIEPLPDFGLNVLHYPSAYPGAVAARNKGAFFARGEVIAFIDDDCLPAADWLEAASRVFDAPDVIGLEGLITSDKEDDPDWRPVTNRSVLGEAFMTANLFVRSSSFQQLGGFNLMFDTPHFREDTDFGWRLARIGKVVSSEAVHVYHPPHRRDVERESAAERNRFFVKDALLYKLHPVQYPDFIRREGHIFRNKHFRDFFFSGARLYSIDPKDMRQLFEQAEASFHLNSGESGS